MSCLTLTLSALAIAGSHMLSDPPAQPIEPDACLLSFLTAPTSSAATARSLLYEHTIRSMVLRFFLTQIFNSVLTRACTGASLTLSLAIRGDPEVGS